MDFVNIDSKRLARKRDQPFAFLRFSMVTVLEVTQLPNGNLNMVKIKKMKSQSQNMQRSINVNTIDAIQFVSLQTNSFQI